MKLFDIEDGAADPYHTLFYRAVKYCSDQLVGDQAAHNAFCVVVNELVKAYTSVRSREHLYQYGHKYFSTVVNGESLESFLYNYRSLVFYSPRDFHPFRVVIGF